MAQATDDNITPLHFVDSIQLRARMAEAVERLLAALDALDAVTEDIEDESDDDTEQEPSLGATNAMDQSRRGVWQSPWREADDLEHEHDGREDAGEREDDPAEMGIGDQDALAFDAEPSLGSADRMVNQEHSYEDRSGWTRRCESLTPPIALTRSRPSGLGK